MNILLSGSTGFVGSHVAVALMKNGHTVCGLVRPSSDLTRLHKIAGVIMTMDTSRITNDVTDSSSIMYDCIVHIGGDLRNEPASIEEAKQNIDANFVFPTLLLRYAKLHGIQQFIHTSTILERHPTTFYGATKHAFSTVLTFQAKQQHMKVIDLTLYTAYGDNDNETKLIPSIFRSFLAKEYVTLKNSDQKLRPTHIDDICGAYVAAVDRVRTMNTSMYEQYDIGLDRQYSIRDIARRIATLTNRPESDIIINKQLLPITYTHHPFRTHEVLGWHALVTLKDGLQKTYESMIHP